MMNGSSKPEADASNDDQFTLITNVPVPALDDPDLFDPHCDPEHPVGIGYTDVASAHYRIAPGIIRTACKKSNLSKQLKMDLFLKLEFQQMTGSFKERGARNYLCRLPKDQIKKGVIASSAGNHAQALAYHGKELNIPVTVVMPTTAPLIKVQNCRGHNANVILKGSDMTESKAYAMKIAKLNNIPYVNGYDHPHILAGQGTVAIEIMEQVPDVDAILVPVGGGGLVAGIAAAVKGINPHIQVIGVESDGCPAFTRSMEAGCLVKTRSLPTVADGLAVPVVGCNSLHTCMGRLDKMMAVDDSHIHQTILRLLEVEKCVVEGAGATALAAILAGLLPELEGKKVVAVLSGGNIDSTVLGRVIERGLVSEGRMCRFTAVVSDRPGGISELCGILKDQGVSIKDIYHQRAWVLANIFDVQVTVVCETRDFEHASQLETSLRKRYDRIWWGVTAK